MNVQIYDTLRARLTKLEPTSEPVRVYCCGPTTYDVAHIGHARAALVPDLLIRHLRASGTQVTYVRNITDVDDKILKRAQENGEPPLALSDRMAKLYQADMQAMGCVKPDVEPKVSEHIEEIVTLIESLIEQEAAYSVEVGDGAVDVYYAVRAFPTYGKLSKRDIEQLRVGARIEASDVKRDPLDFALWKGCKGDAWGWDSPWGKGRPGWHIECSAMSSRYLGHGFDVHAGGMDLIFPHHENEIAQSEAAHPDKGDFARIWMHNGFVNIDKEKMAKSLGNFVTIADVYERNDPEALRYFLLTVHYRGPITFDTDKLDDGRVVFPGVDEAERRLDYLYMTVERLTKLAEQASDETLADLPKELGAMNKLADQALERIHTALDDDLNAPMALAVVADLGKAGNELCDLAQKRRKDAKLVQAAAAVALRLLRSLRQGGAHVGLLQGDPADYEARTQKRRLAARGLAAAEIDAKLTERADARKAKDFARSDAIRDELAALRVELQDGAGGTTWRLGV